MVNIYYASTRLELSRPGNGLQTSGRLASNAQPTPKYNYGLRSEFRFSLLLNRRYNNFRLVRPYLVSRVDQCRFTSARIDDTYLDTQ